MYDLTPSLMMKHKSQLTIFSPYSLLIPKLLLLKKMASPGVCTATHVVPHRAV